MSIAARSGGRILVTGSAGLVGSALVPELEAAGFDVARFDIRLDREQDVINDCELSRHVAHCDGVVHLAAVSRVIWGEQDPERCRQVNVGGLFNVLQACANAPKRPWLLFVSSREVYGSCGALPADEDAPAIPVNVYGRTKLDGEQMVRAARRQGLRVATVRLSNVYGSADDHADRVVPAFVRAALEGRPLRVEGRNHTFDFTFVDDVARGLTAVAGQLCAGVQDLPDIQLVSGRGTTLGELADLVLSLTFSTSSIHEGAERNFDVAHFVGDPRRAKSVLGWSHETCLPDGLRTLISEFQIKNQFATNRGGQE